jgi:23S rRNA (pseudouridine1915-N3)-methyltransferase
MIRLIFVGKVKEDWLKEAIDEYIKRISAFTKIEVLEVKDEKIIGMDQERIKRTEGEKILNLAKNDFLIGLDVGGKTLASEEFADCLSKIESKNMTFVVGGALGLSQDVLKRCNAKVSLSKMTFTNQIVRLVLVEQIYRSFMISQGRPYHR